MAATLFSFSAIFAAVLLLTTGIGLLNTTLSLRLTLEDVPIQLTGLIMASYYFGLVLGGLFCHRLVARVGHIRAFATFAAVGHVHRAPARPFLFCSGLGGIPVFGRHFHHGALHGY